MEQSKFRLTLKEMTEKRKILAKAKAQASYQVAKYKRQNKIKSKKLVNLMFFELSVKSVQIFNRAFILGIIVSYDVRKQNSS